MELWEFYGVCARGAFEVNFEWKNKKITKAVLLSKQGGLCKIDLKVPATVKCNGEAVKIKDDSNGVIEFSTKKGEHYYIHAI